MTNSDLNIVLTDALKVCNLCDDNCHSIKYFLLAKKIGLMAVNNNFIKVG